MEKQENKLNYKNKIGILGGSFNPAHKGHLAISKKAAKLYKLKKIIWAITKKNPLKKKVTQVFEIELKDVKRLLEQIL